MIIIHAIVVVTNIGGGGDDENDYDGYQDHCLLPPSPTLNQGVNAALRAVVRTGIYLGCTVTYIKKGFKGLVDGAAEDFEEATWLSTSDVLGRAGTFIKRCEDCERRSRDGSE